MPVSEPNKRRRLPVKTIVRFWVNINKKSADTEKEREFSGSGMRMNGFFELYCSWKSMKSLWYKLTHLHTSKRRKATGAEAFYAEEKGDCDKLAEEPASQWLRFLLGVTHQVPLECLQCSQEDVSVKPKAIHIDDQIHCTISMEIHHTKVINYGTPLLLVDKKETVSDKSQLR